MVAPYWSDIDTSYSGQIFYQVFTNDFPSFVEQLEEVSTFVSHKMDVSFSGSWMLGVEWLEVPSFFGSSSEVSTSYI